MRATCGTYRRVPLRLRPAGNQPAAQLAHEEKQQRGFEQFWAGCRHRYDSISSGGHKKPLVHIVGRAGQLVCSQLTTEKD